jgi:hypothetical protein
VSAQNLAVPHNGFVARSSRHEQVIQGLGQVDAYLQKLLAELVMLRLFDEFQDGVSGIAMRLACGTCYVDGTPPALLTTPAKSTSGARQLYATFGRSKKAPLRWSKASDINAATKYVLDPTDAFNVVCSANALRISEMRVVRNRVAHSNAKTRREFSKVVQRHYGASLNSVSPGTLLITTRFSPTLLEQYLFACRTIMRGCAKA